MYDLLGYLGCKTTDLVNCGLRSMIVEARDRIVNHHDLAAEVTNLIQRREEERKSQGVPIAGTQGISEGRLSRGCLATDVHRSLVDNYVISARRTHPRVGEGYALQTESRTEALKVS